VRTLLLLWIFSTCIARAAEPVVPGSWTGPWMVQRDDGMRQIAIAYAPGAPGNPQVRLRAATGELLAVTATWHVQTRRSLHGWNILDLRIAEDACPPGQYQLQVGASSFDLVIPAGPGAGQPARVAVVGAMNYPSRLDMARLAEALHGPIQVAIGLGPHLAGLIGTGGWEDAIPILFLGTGGPDGDDPEAAQLGGMIGDARSCWPHGAHVGALGLPCADAAQAGHAIAEDLSIWQVFVEPHASWNPSLRARADSQPLDALPILTLCQHMHVPAIIAGADGAGFVSEPLSIDHGKLVIGPGGTRYLGATPSGDGLARIPEPIAVAVERPALIGMVADAACLTLVVSAQDGLPPMRLTYLHSDDPAVHLGAGWGGGDAEALKKAWLAADAQSAQALDDLGWLAGPLLSGIHFGDQETATLLAAAAQDPSSMRLLQRLTGIPAIALGSLQSRADSLPPLLLRDLVLRRLGLEQDVDTELRPAAAASSDANLLRALLRAYERSPSQDLSRLLMRRVALQASGALPLEQDAYTEHRLLCALFDSTTISPTPLRPLAKALRPRLDPLGRGPVERFIARHGEERAP